MALCWFCGLAATAWAQGIQSGAPGLVGTSARPQEPGGLLTFDIPAQPLAAALHRYAEISGRPALFRSELVEGRHSAAVRGRYTRRQALRALLEGTGLTAHAAPGMAAGVFVLAQAQARGPSPAHGTQQYGALVQARVWAALCADARTAPGAYRSLFRFWVDDSGRVARARLLTSTGAADRDAALLGVLNDVRIERSPPPGLEQPLTLIVLPRGQGDAPDCDTGAGVK
ncbi:secretin and TonB N-terminal domain-containing protein [Orrella sp. JC864]|uniref:secretin and TonB N-terminal domain-containing protein n=1 Tax=Orrella sp. JC864 TaxID=3120298 RepID=UPI00300A1FA0